MNTLEQLYYGNICPADRDIPINSEYAKQRSRLNDLHDQIKTGISGEVQELLNEYDDLINTLNCLSSKESFIDGFRLGAQLILDILLEQ